MCWLKQQGLLDQCLMTEINTLNCLPVVVKNQVQGGDSQIKMKCCISALDMGKAPTEFMSQQKRSTKALPPFPSLFYSPFLFCVLLKCLPMENWGRKTPELSRSNHGLMEWGSGPQTNGTKANDRLVEENKEGRERKMGWERERERKNRLHA